VRFFNVLNASGTIIQKVFAFVKQNAANAQKTIQRLTARAERNPKTTNAKATTQPTTMI
jgi:hypothetical protein